MIASVKRTFDAAPLYAVLTSILACSRTDRRPVRGGRRRSLGRRLRNVEIHFWLTADVRRRTYPRHPASDDISATSPPSPRRPPQYRCARTIGRRRAATTLVALNLPSASSWVVAPLCAVAAFLAGGVAAYVPGVLKARWRVNEIVSTLAMNFIVVALLGYLLNGPLQSDFANLPQSPSVTPQ